MTVQITAAQFHAADGVEDWRSLYHVVAACFRTGSLTEGIRLVDEIGRQADEVEQQYLRVDLRHDGVTVHLGRRDVALARRISAAASKLDVPADPTALQLINVTLDALVAANVLPFWRALLGYDQIGDDHLFDPSRRGPGFGLQQMNAARPQRNRLHLDIAVPHDLAEARVAAALAAGGHLVSDAHAPKWWVLADAEGNEACIATWVGRESSTAPADTHTRRFGDRAGFCVEIGEITPPSLRTVDLWAGGKWLTTDDNTVYLPSFIHVLRSTAARVRRRDVSPCPFPERSPEEIFRLLHADDESDFRERFWLMHWGETVDNVTSYVYLDGEDLVIVFGFRPLRHPFPEDLGKVFVARIPADEFAGVLEQAADLLDGEFAR